MKRRALITGGCGFVGSYIADHLREQGREVLVTGLRGGDVRLDVTDMASVQAAVTDTAPHEIYHLAGITRPASGDTDAFYRVNVDGTRHVLEAVEAAAAPACRVLYVGSAYAYGRADGAIAEERPLAPRNHYGASKAAAEVVAGMYAARGLHVVIARPFNHSGPGQPPDFVLPTLVQQAAAVLRGERGAIALGNLEPVRDFSDVRDVVRGYVAALESGTPGRAFNFGSGRGRSVRELLELVLATAGLDGTPVESAPSRQRPDDLPSLVADISRARDELGWQPTIALAQTVADMLAAATEHAPTATR